ncbi:hypothetical protein, partial [Bradyrhizobium hipponense]|uniref:hypothetical protein n=1 Tax=Bradyrhizobium hipponense TaxID=2605638 RepID=UPI001AEEB367
DVRGMIIEDQLDRGPGRIGGIEELEEFYELSAAVAVFDERVDLPGEQVNPRQQAECHSACNIGSDSLLMQFGGCVAL